MQLIRILATVLLCFVLAAAPDETSRRQAREDCYQSLVTHFGKKSKAFWNSEQVAVLPSLLRMRLEFARNRQDGCGILGVLDAIDDLDTLTQDELVLRAQVAWAEEFFKDGRKAANGTGLAPLFQALERDRRGKVEKGQPTILELVRTDGYAVLGRVDYRPFRKTLLKFEADRILASDAFLSQGTLPPRFDRAWLDGFQGPPALWDAAWTAAWASPSPVAISALLIRIPYYRPAGLTSEQQRRLEERCSKDWNLPYLWAQSGVPLPPTGFLPPVFETKVQASLGKVADLRRAERLLASVADNPRDHLELAIMLEGIGDEVSLGRLLTQQEMLLRDPGIPGWKVEDAKEMVLRVSIKAAKLKEARLLEARLKAEQARRAALLKQQSEEQHRRWKSYIETRGLLRNSVHQAIKVLSEMAAEGIQSNPSGYEKYLEQLARIYSPFATYPSLLEKFIGDLKAGWDQGPARAFASLDYIPLAERNRVLNQIRQTLSGIHPSPGARDPIAPQGE